MEHLGELGMGTGNGEWEQGTGNGNGNGNGNMVSGNTDFDPEHLEYLLTY